MPGRGRGWWLPLTDVSSEEVDLPKNEFVETVKKEMDRSWKVCLGTEGTVQVPKHLLDIFPEEIWIQILDEVTVSEDLESLSNASPFLRQLLLPKRVLFLFPKVWEILAVKCEREKDSANLERLIAEEELGSSGAPEQQRTMAELVNETRTKWDIPWFSIILTFRLVCKTWCWTLNDFYQNLPHRYEIVDTEKIREEARDPHVVSRSPPEIGSWIKHTFFEYDVLTMQKFLDIFEQTHGVTGRNPFLGRCVLFDFWRYDEDDYEEFHDFCEGISSLLSKYGHHIWYCLFDVNYKFSVSSVPFYRKVREWLGYLPNLKVLGLWYWNWESLGCRRPWTDIEEELESEINLNPLPTIGSLEVLKIGCLSWQIFNHLITRNGHVSTLQVERHESQNGYVFGSTPFPNLKQVSIKLLSVEDLEGLEALQTKWPMEKIRLNFSRDCAFIK